MTRPRDQRFRSPDRVVGPPAEPSGEQLPASVRAAFARMRAETDTRGEELQSALTDALDRAERLERVRRAQPTGARRRHSLVAAFAFLPSAAGVAIAFHFAIKEDVVELEREAIDRVEQLEVHWPHGAEQMMLDLGLETHHHEGSHAEVHVEVPADVGVHAPHPVETTAGRECDGDRCVHRFLHPEPDTRHAPVQIQLDRPGRYRIRVEHSSRSARVREEFVVEARRRADPLAPR